MGSLVSPNVANLYMEYFEQNALSNASHPPNFGRGMWMTHLSSRRKSTNRTTYNTLTVLTLPSSLQWRPTRRMVQFPSWTSLLNHRLMGIFLSLCTGNLPTQTSIYSGTVTTTSQQNLVLSTPSTIGLKQCVAILSFFVKKFFAPGRHSPNANTLNRLQTRWRKGLAGPPGMLLMGLTIRVLQAPSPLPLNSKQRVILLASRRSVGGMAYRPTSKVVAPSRTYWYPPRTKTPLSVKVGPYIGSTVVTLPVMMNT